MNCHLEIVRLIGIVAAGCTTVAVLPEASLSGHTLLGQNDDEIAACIDSFILLEIKRKEGLTSFNFMPAGMLPTNGMNSAGIGLLQVVRVNPTMNYLN